jgi:putative selenate reductase
MPPKKIGRHLTLFDCYTCDKCIPVCPNDANFSFVVPKGALRAEHLLPGPHGWTVATGTATAITKPRQFATFADACNECGNCDVQCPEDGGPYLVKPLFFGSLESWTAAPQRDGFVVERLAAGFRMHGRFGGRVVRMETGHGGVRYSGSGFDLHLDLSDPAGTADGAADGPVDLTPLRIMDQLLHAVTAAGAVNFVTAAIEHSAN